MITTYDKAVENIRNELKSYIISSNLKALVIGVSGGIDSALCIALAAPVCEELFIPLIGCGITIESNKPEEINRAGKAGRAFCTEFIEVDLTENYKRLLPVFQQEEDDFEDIQVRIRFGNVKARMRMILLYDLAQRRNGMVLSTDNKTELLLGFWTLHGDVGDFGMIQNLWKTEVYAMAQYLAEQDGLSEEKREAVMECIRAVPTDGLGVTESDLEQLGADSYSEVDMILIEYLEKGNTSYEEHPVIQRNRRTDYKRNNPWNIPREKIVT